MKTTIGIHQEHLEQITQCLATVLADEYILLTKTRKAHWNVEGIDFYSMHLFFESQYQKLDVIIDDVAERIRTIGQYVPATLKRFLSLTHLTEELINGNNNTGYIKELLADHETVIIKIREQIYNDQKTVLNQGAIDFLTGIMKTHEKMAWMLRVALK